MYSRQSDPSPSTRAAGALALAGLAALLVHAQPATPPAGTAFDVEHYAVALTLDVAAGRISGTERIELTVRDATTSLVFDSGTLVVDSVRVDAASGGALRFEQRERHLIVHLPATARAGEPRSLEIRYHGAPRTGLTLHAARAQAYTTFSTSQWMVAVDAPSDRATLELDVTTPADWKAAGSGRFIDRSTDGGFVRHSWQQDLEMPSYTFGFVAGSFTEATEMHGELPLTYLGSGFSAQELKTIFRATPEMVTFFEDRAGLPFPGDGYTQALVAASAGQEMAGLSHMSEAYGRSVLADATATALIAHELAHQWWGNVVTNHDWTHFWLNEGFATFMAAAYKERARGRDAYMTDVDGWRRRVEQLRTAGADKPLVFPDWNRPSTDDRAVVYQKGALALHELRELMGDAAFWTAVRAYTTAHVGRAVTSSDLQRAFEASSGRSLAAFFDERVHLQ